LGYQVNVKVAKDGTDELEIAMVSQIGDQSIDEIEKQIADDFGVPARLLLSNQLDPQTETGAYISWKHARIRDCRLTL
jgi:phenylacetate-CoA ligase